MTEAQSASSIVGRRIFPYVKIKLSILASLYKLSEHLSRLNAHPTLMVLSGYFRNKSADTRLLDHNYLKQIPASFILRVIYNRYTTSCRPYFGSPSSNKG